VIVSIVALFQAADASAMAARGIKTRAREFLRPLARLVADLGISPSAITIAGLVLSAFGGWSLATGHFVRSGLLLVVAGICDVVDGATARAGNRATATGAFLDSTIDRYSEIFVFLGALVYYLVRSPHGPEVLTSLVIFLGLSGSLMVSYTRARAEAVGESCEVGIAERPERLVILIVGALFGADVFRVALWILAVLANITALHRIQHVLTRRRA
jgi:CDP-diacylglycerol--glycerol-3-phosphate 3-phosphatidyltransferase